MKMATAISLGILGLSLSISTQSKVFADGGDASLVHACVAKDGTMRIVSASTTCKNSETALHWATVGRVTAIETKNNNQDTAIAGAVSTNSAQNTAISNLQAKDTSQDAAIAGAGGGGIGVFLDANGTVVGPVVDPSSGLTLRSIPQLGTSRPYALNLNVNAIPDSAGLSVFYTSTDCSGTAYYGAGYSPDDPNSFTNFLHIWNGKILHSTGVTQLIDIRSFSNFDSNGNLGSCNGTDFGGDMQNLEILDLYTTLGVQPPFHIQ